MTDDEETPKSGELDDRIAELGERAQAEYDEDPVGTAIEHLRDYKRDMHPGTEGSRYLSGFEYAEYLLVSFYLSNHRKYWCECERGRPFPHLHREGEWYCGDCGTQLAREGDEVDP